MTGTPERMRHFIRRCIGRVRRPRRPGRQRDTGKVLPHSIEQAKVFHQSFGLTGLIVTKLDGTSRGGAIVGIYRQLKIPIYFIGLGEQPEDLQPFSAENYAKAVFGLE